MGSTVVYAEAISPFSIQSTAAVYATARAGGALVAYGTSSGDVGQNGELNPPDPFNYVCFESFLSFDTSTIVGTITSVVLSLRSDGDGGMSGSVEARLHDWGPTLTTADWVAGADLASKTLLAAYPMGTWPLHGWRALTSEAAFIANINRTGKTRMVICGSNHRLGNAPTDYFDYIRLFSGTVEVAFKPKLDIVTADGGWGVGHVRMGAN